MKRNYFDLFSKPNSQKELSFGNQSLIGTDDDDIITGGDGNDTLYGGEGADTLYGGSDSDIFVLSYDYIADIVKDFEDGVDIIGLDDSITFESLSISNADGHTSIADKYDGTIYMVLENITASDITADDFITLEVV